MTRSAVLFLSILLLAAAPAGAAEPGYLGPVAVDVTTILPPAPQAGELRFETDRAIFRETRHFVGTPRWDMATADVRLSTADMMRAFSCAVGLPLTAEALPRLVHLLEMASADSGRASGRAKDYFQRLRPYQIDAGQTCQDPAELAGSFDYPSGHTTRGWTWASLLAELVPARAPAILTRGRVFGESRIVCGVHNATAVEAGRTTAAAVLAVLHAEPAFQADLQAARQELALWSGTAGPLEGAACAAETELVGQSIWH